MAKADNLTILGRALSGERATVAIVSSYGFYGHPNLSEVDDVHNPIDEGRKPRVRRDKRSGLLRRSSRLTGKEKGAAEAAPSGPPTC
jgi:hypothetical protein